MAYSPSHPYLVGLVGRRRAVADPAAAYDRGPRRLGLRLPDDRLMAARARAEQIGVVLRRPGRSGSTLSTSPIRASSWSSPPRRRRRGRGRLGAVNTVVFDGDRAVGYNTEPLGSPSVSPRASPARPPTNVVLIGAGGAGAAVGDAMLSVGTEHLTVVDVDVDRAAALAVRSGGRPSAGPGRRVGLEKLSVPLPGSDGVVHATPIGMAEHPGVPFDAALLHPGLWVADIVYRPLDTALLQSARAAGCRTLDGGHMAVHQAPADSPWSPGSARTPTGCHATSSVSSRRTCPPKPLSPSHRGVSMIAPQHRPSGDIPAERTPGRPPSPASWAVPSSITTSSCSVPQRR